MGSEVYRAWCKIWKQQLKMHWVSVEYFTQGWDFFFRQEKDTLLAFCLMTSLLCQYFEVGLWCTLTSFIVLVLLRRVFVGGICTSTKRLDGQVVVVTGSNTGLGKETAKDLSARGAVVVMACRDTAKAERAALEIQAETGGKVEVFKLDLSSLASVRSFAEKLKEKYPKVHILINNAGIMMCPHWKTEDGFEMQMGTNHLGHFLLTQMMLPLMKHGEPARIVTVSSHGHYGGTIPFDDMDYAKGYDPNIAYFNSKAANVLFTRQLAEELKGTQVQVFALHPGFVATELGRHLPLGSFLFILFQFVVKTPIEGAQTSIQCATDAVQHENMYFSDCLPMEPSEFVRDDGVAKKFWELSESLVKAKQ